MAAISFEHADDARTALRAIVSDPVHGKDALSSPQTMSNLLQDLLPDAPREASLLLAAVTAGLPAALREHVALGMDVETAIGLVAATLAAKTAFSRAASAWVATELAVALGLASPDVQVLMPPADEADPEPVVAAAGPGQTQVTQAGLVQAGPAQASPVQAQGAEAYPGQIQAFPADVPIGAAPSAQVTADAWRRAMGTDPAAGFGGTGPTTPLTSAPPALPQGRRIAPAALVGACIVVAGAVVAGAIFLGSRSHSSSPPQGSSVPPGSAGSVPPSQGASTPGSASATPSSGASPAGYQMTSTLDPGTLGSMTQVAWTPDGSAVVTSDKDGYAYLWNPATGHLIRRFTADAGKAFTAAISPDGSTLAVGYSNGSTYLWNIASGNLIAALADPGPAAGKEVDSVAFSPDGRTLVSADGNGYAFVWRLSSDRLARRLRDPAGAGVWSAAFAPDGTLATGDYSGNIYLWNVGSGSYSGPLVIPGGLAVTALAFSPDGSVLAAGSGSTTQDTGSIYLFSTSSQAGQDITNPGSVWAMSFNGSTLAAADGDGQTYLFDVNEGSLTATSTQALADPNSGSQGVGAMDFSPNGQWLVTGDTNGRAFVWSTG